MESNVSASYASERETREIERNSSRFEKGFAVVEMKNRFFRISPSF
jgi:hypothetical protein